MHKLAVFIFCISFLLIGSFPVASMFGIALSLGLVCLGLVVYVLSPTKY